MAKVLRSGVVVDLPDVEVLGTPGEQEARATKTHVTAVKAEAYRRIVAICPEWKQRNLTAQASILADKGRDAWTDSETAAWEAGEAIWAEIKAIRAASDAIEVMDPRPADVTADELWA